MNESWTSRVAPGDRIEVLDAGGEWLPRRAMSGVQPGYTFPVVWACREDEWETALKEGREPEIAPWPADDVREKERDD